MRRDLEHAVSRRVDDERPGAHVLGAELVDDDRSRCRLVAEDRASRPRGKVCQHLAGKAVRKYREGDVENDSHHLPVSGDGVFSSRRLGHPAGRCRSRDRSRYQSRGRSRRQRHEAVESERSQRRDFQRNAPRDVADGVASLIAVRRSVGQLADADTVHDDDDDAFERRHARL